jgi:hypothetical protein
MSKFLEAIHAAVHARSAPDAATSAPDAALENVKVAACALLLEIAYADGEFTAPEQAHLESVLARHFGLAPEAGERLIAVAEQVVARRLENILTYLTHRITNAVTEGLNAKIQWIKYSSRGFRNPGIITLIALARSTAKYPSSRNSLSQWQINGTLNTSASL